MSDSTNYLNLCKIGRKFRSKAILSRDSKYIIFCVEKFIFGYEINTFKCEFELKYNSEYISCVNNYYNDPNFIISSTKEGSIIVWDLSTKTILNHYNINRRIYSIFSIYSDKFIVVYKKKRAMLGLKCNYKYKICVGTFSGNHVLMKDIGNTSCCGSTHLAYSEYNNFFGILGHNCLDLYTVKDNVDKSKLSFVRKGTCLAFHPSAPGLAIGYSDGSILLWDLVSQTSFRKLHWHSNPVADLCFSTDGSYLFSGGIETVLVRWNLETFQKYYLPRLGCAIRYIVISDLISFIIQDNNEITLFDPSNLKPLKKLLNFQRSEAASIILKYEHESDTLILNGQVGSLSFYSPSIASTSYSLDVVQQNYIGFHNNAVDSLTSQFDVSHALVSKNNIWFYTVEQTLKNEFSRLKAWIIGGNGRNFELKHCIESPHDKLINHIDSCLDTNFNDILVTCSNDGSTKIWNPLVSSTTESSDTFYSWICANKVTHGGLVPKFHSFSPNNTIIAIVTPSFIFLYEFPSMSLKSSIATITPKHVLFPSDSRFETIVISSNSCISVFDLNDNVMVWNMHIKHFAAFLDPISSNICLFSKRDLGYKLIIYDLKLTNILQTIDLPDFEGILCAVFGAPFKFPPKNLKLSSSLYFMTLAQDIYVIGEESIKLCNFKTIFDKEKISNNINFDSEITSFVKKENSARNNISITLAKQFMEKMDSTSSHLLPTPDALNMHHLNAVLSGSTREKKKDHPKFQQANLIDDLSTTTTQIITKKEFQNDIPIDTFLQNSVFFKFNHKANMLE